MTLSEFKAWFEGFTENLDGPPNKKQWARICKRVKEIQVDSTPIVVERYLRPYWDRVWCGVGTSVSDTTFTSNTAALPSNTAYNMLGKADALQIGTKVSPTNG